MYNQFEVFRVIIFTQSLSVTSVNTYHTSVNEQGEQMDFQDYSYLNGSERMSCIVEHKLKHLILSHKLQLKGKYIDSTFTLKCSSPLIICHTKLRKWTSRADFHIYKTQSYLHCLIYTGSLAHIQLLNCNY